MTPEEVELLANAIMDSSQGGNNYSSIWVLISFVTISAPFVIRHFKNVNQQLDQQEKLMAVMDMHIDELKHVKLEVEEVKKGQIEMGLNIRENTTKIGGLRDLVDEKCA